MMHQDILSAMFPPIIFNIYGGISVLSFYIETCFWTKNLTTNLSLQNHQFPQLPFPQSVFNGHLSMEQESNLMTYQELHQIDCGCAVHLFLHDH